MDSIIILIYVYMFLIGMCVASFMNVVIDRVPRNESFVKGRSHCDYCGETLKWYDLIPIVSYIFLRGKCRYSIETILMFVIAMILLAITMIDFDTMIIPDGLNIAMFIVSIVLMYVRHMSLLESIMGMFCISVPMILLNVLIAESFGGGDIKLMFVSGIALGWKYSLLAAFIGILLAGSYSIYLLISKKINKKGHIAFGPYLSIGIFIALSYGSEIISWYLNLMM